MGKSVTIEKVLKARAAINVKRKKNAFSANTWTPPCVSLIIIEQRNKKPSMRNTNRVISERYERTVSC